MPGTERGGASCLLPASRTCRVDDEEPPAVAPKAPATTKVRRRRATAPGGGLPIRYHYLLLPGNNSGLVREVLRRRPWWGKLPATEEGGELPPFNLRWKSITDKIPWGAVMASSIRQMVNHIPKHSCLTTKSGLYRHLATLAASQGQPLLILHPCILIRIGLVTAGLDLDTLVPRTFVVTPNEVGKMEGLAELEVWPHTPRIHLLRFALGADVAHHDSPETQIGGPSSEHWQWRGSPGELSRGGGSLRIGGHGGGWWCGRRVGDTPDAKRPTGLWQRRYRRGGISHNARRGISARHRRRQKEGA